MKARGIAKQFGTRQGFRSLFANARFGKTDKGATTIIFEESPLKKAKQNFASYFDVIYLQRI